MKPFSKRPKIGTLVKILLPLEEYGKVIQHPKERDIIAIRTELGVTLNVEWSKCAKTKQKKAKTPTQAWHIWVASKTGEKITQNMDSVAKAGLLVAFKAGWQARELTKH